MGIINLIFCLGISMVFWAILDVIVALWKEWKKKKKVVDKFKFKC